MTWKFPAEAAKRRKALETIFHRMQTSAADPLSLCGEPAPPLC